LIRQNLVVLLALLACFGTPAGAASGADAAWNSWSRYAGQWTPTADARAQVTRAVEHVTGKMGLLVRAIARRRLLARCQPPRELRIRVSNGEVAIEFVGMETHVMPLSGVMVQQAGRTLSVQSDGGVLVHRGTTSEGTRVNRFSVDPSGRELTMDTVMTSPRLPEPVRFRVRFWRTDDRKAPGIGGGPRDS
jgi:hypothetical protein